VPAAYGADVLGATEYGAPEYVGLYLAHISRISASVRVVVST
jgi:hypothetical protein